LGKALVVVAGLVFMLLCMLLPLVGPAGSATPYADKNHSAFTAVLVAALLTSGLATYVNLIVRKKTGAGLPRFAMALTVLTILVTIAFMLGLMKI